MTVIAILASGPSLARWQIDHAVARADRVIAINTTALSVPEPAICYAADGAWWKVYHDAIARLGHEGWTTDEAAARDYGLRYIPSRVGRGLCREPFVLHQGMHSGFQAIQLAVHLGARRILLAGYDMQWSGGAPHHHGHHPSPLRQPDGIAGWLKFYPALAADLAAEGIEVVNATIETALTCFPRADLRDAL